MSRNTNKRYRLSSIPIDGAITLAFFTAALYITGSAFYGGYLHEWGLSSTLFSKSFHQTLYSSSITWFIFCFKFTLYTLLLAGISLGILILFYTKLKGSFKAKRITIKLLRFIRGKKSNSYKVFGEINIVKIVLSTYHISLFFLVLIFFTYSLLYLFQNEGKKSAIKQKEQIINESGDIKNFIIMAKYKDKNETLPVVIIDCSNSFCAVSKTKDAKIYFMSLPSFEIIKEK